MPRPCQRKHPNPNHFARRCEYCRLYLTDERWQAYWDGPLSPPLPKDTGERPPRIITGSSHGRIARDYIVPDTDPVHPDAIATRKAQQRADTCRHFGKYTGEMQLCGTCPGRTMIKLFQCAIHGACSVKKELPNVACCETCQDYNPASDLADKAPMLNWTCGITTVPSRKDDLFPRTLASIEAAGFPKPTIFVDGASFKLAQWYEDKYAPLGYSVEVRRHRIYAWGNWLLGLWDLYLRHPSYDRYAMFQDDVVFCKNLKRYLECSEYPSNGYWNLYTNPPNQTVIPRTKATRRQIEGWHPSNQLGFGALGLVFDNATVLKMFSHHHFPVRTKDADRGREGIDGAVVSVFNVTNGQEYIHHPSLVQHLGEYSTIQRKAQLYGPSKSFPGEGFDALKLLQIIEANKARPQ